MSLLIVLCRESEQLGLTVLRTWAFADGPQWNSIQPSLGQLDERVLSEVGHFPALMMLMELWAPAACRRVLGSRAEGTGNATDIQLACAEKSERGLIFKGLWGCCVGS